MRRAAGAGGGRRRKSAGGPRGGRGSSRRLRRRLRRPRGSSAPFGGRGRPLEETDKGSTASERRKRLRKRPRPARASPVHFRDRDNDGGRDKEENQGGEGQRLRAIYLKEGDSLIVLPLLIPGSAGEGGPEVQRAQDGLQSPFGWISASSPMEGASLPKDAAAQEVWTWKQQLW